MAKQRYIKPKFWSDAYIQELDANTKLLYLYLMTNEHNNIAWIYEITEKTMCFEIWYPSNTLSKGIDKLSKDWKIIYIDWWMILKNHVKNQNTKSQTVKDWIKRIISELPPSIRDRVCIGYIGDSIYLDFNFNLNLDLNLNLNDTTKKNNPPLKDNKEEKILHLNYVYLTNEEYNKLIDDYWKRNIKEYIEKLNIWIGSKWYKYKSHYFTILNWLRKDWVKKIEKIETEPSDDNFRDTFK